MDNETPIWKAGLNEFVLTVGGLSGRFPPLGCWARVLSLTFIIDNTGNTDLPVARWFVQAKVSDIICVVAASQTLPTTTPPTTPATTCQAIFLVNQQPVAPQQDVDSSAILVGFLPPDLWLTPTSELAIDQPLYGTVGVSGLITQAILRFYVPPQ